MDSSGSSDGMRREELDRFEGFLRDERAAAWLYREPADVAGSDRRAMFERLAATEERHAAHWEIMGVAGGTGNPDVEPGELEHFPYEERRELELIYEAKGLDPEAAEALAERIMAPTSRSTRSRGRSWGSIPAISALPGVPRCRRSSRSPQERSGLRMVAIGGGAALVTYAIGS